MKLFISLLLIFFIVGCGYKPISYHAKDAFGDSVFVDVKFSSRDPQNSVTLKDEMSKMIFERLHINVVDRGKADSIIEAEIKDITFNSLAENTTGFATFYRCEVLIEFKYTAKSGVVRNFTKRGGYNLSLGDSSIITDSIRMDAINMAAIKAVESFVSQIGIEAK